MGFTQLNERSPASGFTPLARTSAQNGFTGFTPLPEGDDEQTGIFSPVLQTALAYEPRQGFTPADYPGIPGASEAARRDLPPVQDNRNDADAENDTAGETSINARPAPPRYAPLRRDHLTEIAKQNGQPYKSQAAARFEARRQTRESGQEYYVAPHELVPGSYAVKPKQTESGIEPSRPEINVIGRDAGGGPFASDGEAYRALEQQGRADTHEVVPIASFLSGVPGFVGVEKTDAGDGNHEDGRSYGFVDKFKQGLKTASEVITPKAIRQAIWQPLWKDIKRTGYFGGLLAGPPVAIAENLVATDKMLGDMALAHVTRSLVPLEQIRVGLGLNGPEERTKDLYKSLGHALMNPPETREKISNAMTDTLEAADQANKRGEHFDASLLLSKTLFNAGTAVVNGPKALTSLTNVGLAATKKGFSALRTKAQGLWTKGAENEQKLFFNKFPDHTLERPNIVSNDMLKKISGRFNYVVMENGQLIVGKRGHLPGEGHIDLAGGKPVLAAGVVSVVNGKIRYIDNTSGHYLPSGFSAQEAAGQAFQREGFDAAGKYVEKVWVRDTTRRGGSWKAVSK